MRSMVQLNLIETPQLVQLPHLPDWAAPNRCDFWGWPWAYMDAPSGNSIVGVTSEEGKARVTAAVLVQLDWEVQYLLDQNVAKSASTAAMRVRKTRIFNEDGSLREDDAKRVMPYTAARTLFPRGWGSDRLEAVYSLLKCWHDYRVSRVRQRPNPPMPQGDVTPEGCDQPAPPREPKTSAVRHQPQDPDSAAGPSTRTRCIKTASVRAAELQAKVKVAAPTTSATRQAATNYATAMGRALDTVQQHHYPQASSEGEAMEQDELPPPSPEQEEQEAEVVCPPQGQCAYGRNKDTSRHSSIDRPVKAVAKGPTQDGQQVSVDL